MVHCRKDSRRKLYWVLFFTSAYLVAEVIGGILSGSLALLADAGHMAMDVAAISLGIFALWIAQKPPDHKKTFGYHRAEILVALFNGAALIAISFWVMVEAWERFQNPRPIRGELMTLVAVGGLFINLLGLWLTHSGKDHSLNMRGVWLHILGDALGSVSALIGGILVWKFGWTQADSIVSALIAILILYGSWYLISEAINVLLEGVPKHIDIAHVRLGLEALEEVAEVHCLHVWTMTSDLHALSAHVKLKEGVQDHAKVLERISQICKERHKINHTTIQLEPSHYSHQKAH